MIRGDYHVDNIHLHVMVGKCRDVALSDYIFAMKRNVDTIEELRAGVALAIILASCGWPA